ncbi:MAG: citryl-CoA lyase [Parcubacteria group bacterium]|nr:citryl-CoA lyase [Parcubacteria group bacterium]
MKFKTKISKTEGNKHSIRGKNLLELIEKHSFTDVIFLLLRGDIPNEKEKALLEAMLVASVENGLEAPSLFVPRVVAASGNDMHVALAAGMLAIGSKHGGAGEQAAMLLASNLSATDIVAQERIVPGFGHKIYKEEDLRARALFEKAKSLGFSPPAGGCYFKKAYEIEAKLAEKKGKKLPLNIDGAIAAVMLELRFDPRLGKAFFLIARIVAMASHVKEEMEQQNSYYRLDETEIQNEE